LFWYCVSPLAVWSQGNICSVERFND